MENQLAGRSFKRKDEFIKDLQQFLKIKSVLDEEHGTEDAPFGQGIKMRLFLCWNWEKKTGLQRKMLITWPDILKWEVAGNPGHFRSCRCRAGGGRLDDGSVWCRHQGWKNLCPRIIR